MPDQIVPRVSLYPLAQQYIARRNPWAPVWWSAALPGFGHLFMGENLKGLILMSWEILVNHQANLNLAIYHSLTGHPELAQQVLNMGWVMIYPLFYMFSMFDAYRSCVEINNMTRLEELQPERQFQRQASSWLGMTSLSRQNPLMAALWSAALPGAGQLYAARGLKSLALMGWYLAVTLKSGLAQATFHALRGEFQFGQQFLDYQWLLFWPSIYIFGIMDAYSDTANQNHVVDEAFQWRMRKYLRRPPE